MSGLDIRCRRIDHWDGPYLPDWERRRSPFEVRWDRQLHELSRELDHLDARDVTIGLDILPYQIRQDGWPKGGASIPDPVSLTFESRVGPLRFQCDRFFPWQANLRAIGLTLQRLRLVDEGGVARSGEQYRGWGALPPGEPIAAPEAMTVERAAIFVACHADLPAEVEHVQALITSPEALDAAYRTAAKRLHPDHGGDPAEFRRLTEARDLLRSGAAR